MSTIQLPSAPVYRISVDEYERMARILDDDRVELIDGYLVKKMGKNPPHVWVTPTYRSRKDHRSGEDARLVVPEGGSGADSGF